MFVAPSDLSVGDTTVLNPSRRSEAAPLVKVEWPHYVSSPSDGGSLTAAASRHNETTSTGGHHQPPSIRRAVGAPSSPIRPVLMPRPPRTSEKYSVSETWPASELTTTAEWSADIRFSANV